MGEDENEINTLGELMRAIAQTNFGGYGSCIEVEVTQENSGGGFLIVKVDFHNVSDANIVENYVGKQLFGHFWFDADDKVMQVL